MVMSRGYSSLSERKTGLMVTNRGYSSLSERKTGMMVMKEGYPLALFSMTSPPFVLKSEFTVTGVL